MDQKVVDEIASLVVGVLKEKGLNGSAPKPGAGTACSFPHGAASGGPPSASASNSNPLLQAGAGRVGHSTDGNTPVDASCKLLASYIDHTLLKPTTTEAEIAELCQQARENSFASVCVNPSYVAQAAKALAGSNVLVCTVIGFPLGSSTIETKAYETRDAIQKGAHEIDMVINIGKLKGGDFQYVCDDIREVVKAAQGRTVKVIIETSMLTDDEKVSACILSKAAGATFVKTSTGFGGGGAKAEDVALMRKVVGPVLGVKASGGIRDCEIAGQMIAAGATRLGASASVAIVRNETGKSSY